MCRPRPIFLTATWKHVLLLNYEVDTAVIEPYIPIGVEPDDYQGRYFVSLVGFQFLDTRVKGISTPGHRNFDEVNLRLYVRREVDGELRRGVVFIKEIVPRRAIAWIARVLYGENYVALPMKHDVDPVAGRVEYGWRSASGWNRMRAAIRGEPVHPAPGSPEAFIIEHYWGYTARTSRTDEYAVEHPPWRVYDTSEPVLECHVTELYGETFHPILSGPPSSAFVAEGSAVMVRRGSELRA